MNRTDLLQHLNNARPFLASTDFIPALTHFNFSEDGVAAFNDTSGIKITLDTELRCAVLGQLILKILNTMSSTTVRVEHPNDKFIRLVDGRSKVKLPILDTADFISLFIAPSTEGMQLIKLPITFFKGLEKCLINVNEDPAHKEQNGIFWSITKDQINIYSTDDLTISKFSLSQENASVEEPVEVLTEKFFCEQLVSLAKVYAEGAETIDLYFGEKHVIAEIGTNVACKIYTRAMIHSLTSYEDIIGPHIQATDENAFMEIPENFHPILERAAVILASKKADKVMSVTVEGKELIILSESDFGRVVDTVEVPMNLGEFNFNIDPTLFQRGFKVTTKVAILPGLTLMKDDNSFLHLLSYIAGTTEE